MTNKLTKIIVMLASCVITLGSLCFANELTNKKDRVLLISSYSPSFSTFFEQVDGIKSVFNNESIVFDIEFMDSKRLYTKENIENFYNSLSYKLSNLPEYDLILVSDDIGLEFVIQYKNELFLDKPVIFLGVNNLNTALVASKHEDVSGVIEEVSLKETIDIALSMNPKATTVVAISDGTVSGQSDLEKFDQLRNTFQQIDFEVIDLSKISFDSYKIALQQIDDTKIILLLSAYSDSTNKRIEFDEVLRILETNTSEPVYHPYYHGIGDGLLGGMVVSHKEQGKTAASMALKVLNGADISSIEPVQESPNKYVFDYHIMEKFGYNIGDIPVNSEIINYTPSIFKEYLVYIIMVVTILVAESMLIFFLSFNIKKRKVSELKLRDKQKELITANDEISSTYEELYASFEEVELKNRKIEELINIDFLTGLNNRFAMSKKIDDLISESDPFAIMFIDIDNFKAVNDIFGHDIGDEVIKVTSSRIKKIQTEEFYISRFGGDEFLIAFKTYDKDERLKLVIEKLTEAFSDRVIIGKNQFFLTASVGIVKYPDHGMLQNDLIKKADMALYESKANGKNSFTLYDEALNKSMLKKTEIQQIIKAAYNNKKFELYYQPIIDAKTSQIKGFEALIRHFDEDRGFIPANEIISNAEEMGLIIDISEWVIVKSLSFLKNLNNISKAPLMMSINISPFQFKYSGFCNQLINTISSLNLDPRQVCLEVTETIFLGSLTDSERILHKLRDYGICISLDDFGTGYSSLEYLHTLPVDILKIDKKFIQNMDKYEFDYLLVEIMHSLAKKRNMEVVAEGVEQRQQLDNLRKLGCEYIQGYYFSKPLTEKDAISYVMNNK